MSDASDESYLERVVRVLEHHQVQYLIIGGQAEHLFGSPRVTLDVDICYERSPENLSRLAVALQELHARLRGVPEGVPFQLDAHALKMGNNFTFITDAGPLDTLGFVEPLGEYKDLARNAEVYEFLGFRIKTISLEDLIRVKQHIKRNKDTESLLQLLAIKRVREEH